MGSKLHHITLANGSSYGVLADENTSEDDIRKTLEKGMHLELATEPKSVPKPPEPGFVGWMDDEGNILSEGYDDPS